MQTAFFNSLLIVIFMLCTFVLDEEQAWLPELLTICISLQVCSSYRLYAVWECMDLILCQNYASWKNEPLGYKSKKDGVIKDLGNSSF